MSDRWCGRGNHFRHLSNFRTSGTGRPVRDCMDCEEIARKARARARALHQPVLDGVDIDAIHHRRGLVRGGKKAAA